MKKVTMQFNGLVDEKTGHEVRGSLNDLSGVVAADVSIRDQRAYAYSGDKLPKDVIAAAARKVGAEAAVINEEYLQNVVDFKNSLS